MNFLAHLYLSGENEGIKVGNFIGDYMKGSGYLSYPESIRTGVLLHRKIDRFTDTHPLAKQTACFFKPGYGRYAGIVVDIVYDHFLTLSWSRYSIHPLKDFISNAHTLLLKNSHILPAKMQQYLPLMIRNRRLESYSSEQGIHTVLGSMARYTTLPGEQDFAIDTLQKNKPELTAYFHLFMDEIIRYVETTCFVEILKPGNSVKSNFPPRDMIPRKT